MQNSAREPAGESSSRAPPGSRGARDGQGLEWSDAVAEVVRSEVTRSLVKMLRGSTPRPAERRGRARRSSRRHERDDSSSSSTTDVSRSRDESAVAALLGAVRATPTPSTVREGTRGIDPRPLPTPASVGGEQGGGAARELPRGIDPGFPTQLSLAAGTEAEGWPAQATPTPPTRVMPPKIVVNHPYYRIMFDCETYALDNKSVVYTWRQARTLGRRKKDVAQSFGVRDEMDGSPPAEVFQFLRKFSKACDDNDISEGEAFYILPDFTKEPLKSEVMMVMPTRRANNPGEVTSYLELINEMLRRHVDEASVATLVDTLNVAVQRDEEDELSFAERLRRLDFEYGFMYGEGALKGRFVEGVHQAARATVRERNTPGMTMAEVARVAQAKGDEHRWLRPEQLKERTKEREVLAEEARLRWHARAAALPRISGGARGYPPRDAPVQVVGAVDAPTPGGGERREAARPTAPDGSTPGGGDNSRRRFRQRDEPPRPKPRTGKYPCWQCGKVGNWAEVCQTLDARLRDRLAAALRWSLSGRPRAPETPGGWADGWQLPPPKRTPAQAAMSRRRLRTGNLGPSPSADRQPPLSPRRETSNHRCWALPAATGGPSSGRGCDASTHPLPTQGDPPSGCTPPEGAGRPECGGHPDGVQISGGQPHPVGRGTRVSPPRHCRHRVRRLSSTRSTSAPGDEGSALRRGDRPVV